MMRVTQKHDRKILPPSVWWPWAVVLFIILGVWIYFSSLHNPFLMDDHAFFDETRRNISQWTNQLLPDLPERLGLPHQGSDPYYRPIAHLILTINYWLFGDNVVGYHAMNLAMLIAAALGIGWGVGRLFDDVTLGLLTGALYLVHPVNGFYVNYITAFYFPLQAVLMMLALVGMKTAVVATARLRRIFFDSLSLVLFLLSLGCHETAMALPFYGLAYLRLHMRLPLKTAIIRTLPMFVVLGIYFAWRMSHASLQTSILEKFRAFDMTFWEFAASVIKVNAWYLSKIFLPSGIVMMWLTPVVRTTAVWWILGLAAAVAAFLAASRYFRPASPWIVGGTWLGIAALPVAFASVYQTGHFWVEPHWYAFGVLGIFLMMAFVIVRLLRWRPLMTSLACAVLLLSWVRLGHAYNYLWGDEIRYATYWLSEVPAFKPAHLYIGRGYLIQKRWPEAKAQYQQAMLHQYSDWVAYCNLGLIEMMQGHTEAARQYFLTTLAIEPRAKIALNSLGVMEAVAHHDALAEDYFRRSIAAYPLTIAARTNLARIKLRQHRREEARQLYREILTIDPRDAEARRFLDEP